MFIYWYLNCFLWQGICSPSALSLPLPPVPLSLLHSFTWLAWHLKALKFMTPVKGSHYWPNLNSCCCPYGAILSFHWRLVWSAWWGWVSTIDLNWFGETNYSLYSFGLHTPEKWRQNPELKSERLGAKVMLIKEQEEDNKWKQLWGRTQKRVDQYKVGPEMCRMTSLLMGRCLYLTFTRQWMPGCLGL